MHMYILHLVQDNPHPHKT